MNVDPAIPLMTQLLPVGEQNIEKNRPTEKELIQDLKPILDPDFDKERQTEMNKGELKDISELIDINQQ